MKTFSCKMKIIIMFLNIFFSDKYYALRKTRTILEIVLLYSYDKQEYLSCVDGKKS